MRLPSIPAAYVPPVSIKPLGVTAAKAACIAAIASVTLVGCGTDDNTGGSSATPKGPVEAVDCGGDKALKASGSSAQANAMTRFVTAYEAACPGRTLNYTSSGSGAGVSEFIGGITDFGGSDSPLNDEKGEVEKAAQRCGGNAAWSLPTVFGPIAVTYNLAGIDGLALDGPVLAKIFSGVVTKWDAPEVASLNPGVSLPADEIHVLFRSDESGTTDNFQKYLAAASNGVWDKGTGKTFAGGVGEGAKGNEGTSAAIRNTPGSISYNEWSYAKSQKLSVARIITSAGPDPVVLSVDTVGKSIDAVKVKGEGNDLVLDTNSFYLPTERGAYPIVLATYEIVCSKYPDPEVPQALKAFLTVAASEGQKGLEDNGYIPIPAQFKERLVAAIDAIS